MPTSQDGRYIIISRPRFDKNAAVWLFHASIVADGDERNFDYRQFMDLNTRFEREEQALHSASSLLGSGLTSNCDPEKTSPSGLGVDSTCKRFLETGLYPVFPGFQPS